MSPSPSVKRWIEGPGPTPGSRLAGADSAARRLRADRVREVCLTVDPANLAAIDLYASLGFAAEQDVRVDYFGPGADRVIMRLTL